MDGFRVKSNDTPGVAELFHGQKRRRMQRRDNMHTPCNGRQTGEIQVGLMGRIHDGAIGVCDPNGLVGRDAALVDTVGSHCTKMRRAAGIGDGERVGRNDCGGRQQKKN